MIREEYLRRLVDEAYLDLYLSANDGARVYWPWRMQPVHEAAGRYRNACEHYIVDSSFKDENITNRDVLDKAAELDAEVAVLADVYQDMDGTIAAVLDGLDLADDHHYDGDLMAPLQPPHDECYAALAGQADMYAIGGLKDASGAEKATAARTLRDLAGPDVHIHGLGFGATDPVVRAVQDDPGLLDSVDYSTPLQGSMRNISPGEERMSVVATRSAATLVEDLREFSPYTDDQPEPAYDWAQHPTRGTTD